MFQQVLDKVTVAFYDVAVYFSEEEWKRLQEGQKELYRNVMKEVHQALIFLGYQIVNPNTLVRIIKRKEIWDFQEPVKTNHINESISTCHPAVHPDIFLRLKQEEKMSCRDLSYFEKLEISNNLIKDETTVNFQIPPRRKTEDNFNLKHRRDTEVSKNKDCTGPPFFNPDSWKEEEESRAALVADHGEGAEHRTSPRSGSPFFNPDVCWKEEEESKAVLVTHCGEEGAEHRTSPSSGYEVISVTIKEEEDAYPLDDQGYGRRESINCPTGFGTMEKTMKTGDHIQCTNKETESKAPSEKANEKEPPSSEKGTYAKSQMGLENNQQWESKATTQYGSDFSNPTDFTLYQDILKVDGLEKYYCGRNLMDSELFTFQQNSEQKCPPYTCTECGKSFSLKGNLITHMRTHTREKPYQCAECGKSFSLKRNLSRHQRTHKEEKERPYQCTECEKSFSQKDNLIIHKRTHTGERPFQCTECEKRFSVKANLITHRRIHSGERPYQCTECEKSFSQKDHLIGHKSKHTGVRPYQCTRCDKTFSFKGSLIRHQSAHTGTEEKSQTEKSIIPTNMNPIGMEPVNWKTEG